MNTDIKPTSIKPPRAVFFDWDGTLVDTLVFLEGAHDHILKTLGMEAQEKGWFTDYFGQPRDFIYKGIYTDQRVEAQRLFEEYVQANHIGPLQPMDGAQEMLQLLQDHNIPMGIVTNKIQEFVAPESTHFGWDHYFKTIVGAGEASEDKPSAAPLLLAIERAELDMDISDIWYVGDTRADMGCAKNAGAKMVYLEYLSRDDEWLTKYPPLLRAKNCKEITAFLLQILEK